MPFEVKSGFSRNYCCLSTTLMASSHPGCTVKLQHPKNHSWKPRMMLPGQLHKL